MFLFTHNERIRKESIRKISQNQYYFVCEKHFDPGEISRTGDREASINI